MTDSTLYGESAMTPVFRAKIAGIAAALSVTTSAALDRVCGKDCEEYKDLARELAEYRKKH